MKNNKILIGIIITLGSLCLLMVLVISFLLFKRNVDVSENKEIVVDETDEYKSEDKDECKKTLMKYYQKISNTRSDDRYMVKFCIDCDICKDLIEWMNNCSIMSDDFKNDYEKYLDTIGNQNMRSGYKEFVSYPFNIWGCRDNNGFFYTTMFDIKEEEKIDVDDEVIYKYLVSVSSGDCYIYMKKFDDGWKIYFTEKVLDNDDNTLEEFKNRKPY